MSNLVFSKDDLEDDQPRTRSLSFSKEGVAPRGPAKTFAKKRPREESPEADGGWGRERERGERDRDRGQRAFRTFSKEGGDGGGAGPAQKRAKVFTEDEPRTDRRTFRNDRDRDMDRDRDRDRAPLEEKRSMNDRTFSNSDRFDRRTFSNDERKTFNDDRSLTDRRTFSASDDRRTSNDDRRTFNNDDRRSFDDRRTFSATERKTFDNTSDDRRSFGNDERKTFNNDGSLTERKTFNASDDRRTSSDDRRTFSNDDRTLNSSSDDKTFGDASKTFNDRRTDERKVFNNTSDEKKVFSKTDTPTTSTSTSTSEKRVFTKPTVTTLAPLTSLTDSPRTASTPSPTPSDRMVFTKPTESIDTQDSRITIQRSDTARFRPLSDTKVFQKEPSVSVRRDDVSRSPTPPPPTPVVGLSTALEKAYRRGEDTVDPSNVRPVEVLKKSFEHIKAKRLAGVGYSWVKAQLMGVRQDLVVLHEKSEFAWSVYYYSVEVGLEEGDVEDFGKCSAQLILLEQGMDKKCFKHTSEVAFVKSLRILFHALKRSSSNIQQLHSELVSLTELEKRNRNVLFSLRALRVLNTDNYVEIGKIYRDKTRPHHRRLVVAFAAPLRKKAYYQLLKAYDQLSLEACRELLFFTKNAETVEFLSSLDAVTTTGSRVKSLQDTPSFAIHCKNSLTKASYIDKVNYNPQFEDVVLQQRKKQ